MSAAAMAGLLVAPATIPLMVELAPVAGLQSGSRSLLDKLILALVWCASSVAPLGTSVAPMPPVGEPRVGPPEAAPVAEAAPLAAWPVEAPKPYRLAAARPVMAAAEPAAAAAAVRPGAKYAKLVPPGPPTCDELDRLPGVRVAGGTREAIWCACSWLGLVRTASDLGRCSTGIMRRLFLGSLALAWVCE